MSGKTSHTLEVLWMGLLFVGCCANSRVSEAQSCGY
jgi:hypothetical protein